MLKQVKYNHASTHIANNNLFFYISRKHTIKLDHIEVRPHEVSIKD